MEDGSIEANRERSVSSLELSDEEMSCRHEYGTDHSTQNSKEPGDNSFLATKFSFLDFFVLLVIASIKGEAHDLQNH